MKFNLATDTCCDMLNTYYKDRGIICLNLMYVMDGKDYPDVQTDEACKQFYDSMRNGATPSTSAVNDQAYLDAWTEAYEKNGLPIVDLAFSSGLSATYQSACSARERFLEQHPEAVIYVIDSLSASMGQGLLLHYAANMRDEGKTADEVRDWLEANKLKLCHEFTVDDLVYLKRGGRVSSTAAFFGTMMDIKPVMHMDDAGHLIPVSKVRGRKKALKALHARMEQYAVDPHDQVVFISQGDCREDAEYLAGLIRETMSPKEILIGNVGPVIGSHTGPGVVALFFLGTGREPK